MDKSDLNELKNMLSGLEASIMTKVNQQRNRKVELGKINYKGDYL